MLEAAAMLGIWPSQTFVMTLPELVFVMRGRQRAVGLDPDKISHMPPMTRDRLYQLANELD